MQPQARIVYKLRRVSALIDEINARVGYVTAFLCLPMIFFIMYEVVSRRFFNAPTLWAYEMIIMTFGAYAILSPGYGLLKGSLICVDLVSCKFKPKTAHTVILICYLVFFVPFVLCLLPACYSFALNSWMELEKSWSQWAPPIYPLKTCVPIGWTLLCLQGFSEILKSVSALLELNEDKSAPGSLASSQSGIGGE